MQRLHLVYTRLGEPVGFLVRLPFTAASVSDFLSVTVPQRPRDLSLGGRVPPPASLRSCGQVCMTGAPDGILGLSDGYQLGHRGVLGASGSNLVIGHGFAAVSCPAPGLGYLALPRLRSRPDRS